jgi:hypothetical protein
VAPVSTGQKKCTKCKIIKPLTEFHVESRNKKSGRTAWCVGCTKAHAYVYSHKERTSRRDYYWERGGREVALARHLNNTLNNFDLLQEDYDFLVSLGCQVCGTHPSGKHRLHFDHDHATGKFRGLLCGNCNTALGLLGENPERIMKLISYLKGE